MKLTQTGANLGASLTGNVNKALLLLPKTDRKYSAAQTAAPAGETDKLKMAASKLQTMTGFAQSLSGGDNLSLSNAPENVVKKAGAAGFAVLQVQYNPASLSMDGSAGMSIQESAGGGSESAYSQADTPEETNLRVELMFDAVNTKDAFMWDNMRALTPGDVLQKGKQLANATKGEKETVQKTVEIFVGAIVKARSRICAFVWNRMVFWGEMCSVSVQYTMFNRDGNPVRAKVSLQIRQDLIKQGADRQDEYASEAYWRKAYQRLFESVYEGGAVGSADYTGALLQL